MTEIEGEIDMKIDPSRAKALSSAISSVAQRIEGVAGGRNVCHLISSLLFPSFASPYWRGEADDDLLGIGAVSRCLEAQACF
jgi:hypothetical protein